MNRKILNKKPDGILAHLLQNVDVFIFAFYAGFIPIFLLKNNIIDTHLS